MEKEDRHCSVYLSCIDYISLHFTGSSNHGLPAGENKEGRGTGCFHCQIWLKGTLSARGSGIWVGQHDLTGSCCVSQSGHAEETTRGNGHTRLEMKLIFRMLISSHWFERVQSSSKSAGNHYATVPLRDPEHCVHRLASAEIKTSNLLGANFIQLIKFGSDFALPSPKAWQCRTLIAVIN